MSKIKIERNKDNTIRFIEEIITENTMIYTEEELDEAISTNENVLISKMQELDKLRHEITEIKVWLEATEEFKLKLSTTECKDIVDKNKDNKRLKGRNKELEITNAKLNKEIK